MPWNLTTNYSGSSQNGARLVFGEFHFNDDTNVMSVSVELRTSNAAGDRKLCGFTMIITDTTSSSVTRNAAPATGLNIDDVTYYFTFGVRSTPTGYSDMFANMRAAANTRSARRTANEAWMFSAGHIDPVSLAGS